MIKLTDVLVQPIQTEKTQLLSGKYVFLVHPDSTKSYVKMAVESFYGVKVDKVNIVKLPEKNRIVGRGKLVKKRSELKKAIVTLVDGETLDFNAIK